MRVALDGRSLASPVLRGWDRYAIGLATELAKLGVEVTFLHPSRQPLHSAHLEGVGCRVLGLREHSGAHYEQVVVPWTVWKRDFDLFHAPFEYGVPLACPRPVVFTIHSATVQSYTDLTSRGLLPGSVTDYLDFDPKRFHWYAPIQKAGIRRADHILTPSQFSREEIIRLMGVPAERVTATPLGVPALFEQPPNPPESRRATLQRLGVEAPFLLFVGGYERHKNVDGLLEAFEAVRRTRPDLSLVLVGSRTPSDTVLGRIQALELEPGQSVRLLTGLGPELLDLYDACEALVTLSWRETFCLPALEAMKRGKPVVASAWGAAPEVVGEAGRLVDPRDPSAARDAILELLSADRAGLERQARDRAAQFSWARTAEQTLEVYERALRKTRRRASQCG